MKDKAMDEIDFMQTVWKVAIRLYILIIYNYKA